AHSTSGSLLDALPMSREVKSVMNRLSRPRVAAVWGPLRRAGLPAAGRQRQRAARHNAGPDCRGVVWPSDPCVIVGTFVCRAPERSEEHTSELQSRENL